MSIEDKDFQKKQWWLSGCRGSWLGLWSGPVSLKFLAVYQPRTGHKTFTALLIYYCTIDEFEVRTLARLVFRKWETYFGPKKVIDRYVITRPCKVRLKLLGDGRHGDTM